MRVWKHAEQKELLRGVDELRSRGGGGAQRGRGPAAGGSGRPAGAASAPGPAGRPGELGSEAGPGGTGVLGAVGAGDGGDGGRGAAPGGDPDLPEATAGEKFTLLFLFVYYSAESTIRVVFNSTFVLDFHNFSICFSYRMCLCCF